MASSALELFDSVLALNELVYFEWGSGGSTSFAAHRSEFAISVESSTSWYTRMLKRSTIQCLIKNYRLSYSCIGAGPTAVASLPYTKGMDNSFLYREQIDKIFAHLPRIPEDQTFAWEAYVTAIDAYPKNSIGVVLVDGRFRVACALKALSHLIASNGTLLLHDAQRPVYHDLLKYYDTVAQADSLIAMKPKPNLQPLDRLAWKKYTSFFP